VGSGPAEPLPEALIAYSLLATFLLTGGRESEVTRLELDDVSLDRNTITFRPNAWRRLKTPGSHRVIRLWPQLAGIHGPYLHWRLMERGGQLLFPSPWVVREQPVQDVRGLLDRIATGSRSTWSRWAIGSRSWGLLLGTLLRRHRASAKERPAITEVTAGRKVRTSGPG
jgi:integrase